jgi:hypothetical protein
MGNLIIELHFMTLTGNANHGSTQQAVALSRSAFRIGSQEPAEPLQRARSTVERPQSTRGHDRPSPGGELAARGATRRRPRGNP